MSILIRGMEMQTSCWRCMLSQLYEKPREMLVCKITHEEVLRNKVDGNCPLVPVPPHGRLIDADALLTLCKDYAITPDDDEFCKRLEYALTKASTIIETEEGE